MEMVMVSSVIGRKSRIDNWMFWDHNLHAPRAMVADRVAWYYEYSDRSPDFHKWKIGVADKSIRIHEPALVQ